MTHKAYGVGVRSWQCRYRTPLRNTLDPFASLHLSEAPTTEILSTTKALGDIGRTFYARRVAGPNPAGFLDHSPVGGFAEFHYEFRRLPECIGRRSRPAVGTKSQHSTADHTVVESAQ